MRLQQFMAACGVASRRACETIIREGRVRVNGQTAEIGNTVDPDADTVTVDGKRIVPEHLIYVLLNKPKGTVTSAADNFSRKTVLDCVKGVHGRVFPVGRLDMDVEGALLLTNDGDLAHRLMHPKFEIQKVYRAKVRGQMTPDIAHKLEKGVYLPDGKTAPCKVRMIMKHPNSTVIELTLHEGRNHEVKRMCEGVGHPVRDLRRLSIANISMRGLAPGQWRHLSAEEVKTLYRLTGLEKAGSDKPKQKVRSRR